jgi:hypothetical protein
MNDGFWFQSFRTLVSNNPFNEIQDANFLVKTLIDGSSIFRAVSGVKS